MRSNTAVRCPRCGYDQRGVMATWTGSCPLSSVCTECGLQIEWGTLLNPVRRVPGWCVEYASRRGLAAAILKTIASSLWPWHFWSSSRMDHEPRWGRLAAYLASLYVLPFLVLPILNGVAAAQIWTWFKFGQPQAATSNQWSTVPGGGRVGGTVVFTSALTSLEVLLRGTFTPLSPSVPGTVTASPSFVAQIPSAAGGFGYPSAREQLVVVLGSHAVTLQSTGGYWATDGRSTEYGSLAGWGPASPMLDSFWAWLAYPFRNWWMFWLAPVLFAATFAVLPQSRRQAKVRWRHIIRICVYSLAFPSPITAAVWLQPHLMFVTGMPPLVSSRGVVGYFMALIVMWFIWWSVATGRYLKMRHPWGVGLAAIVIGLLLTGAIAFYGQHLVQGRNPFHYGW